MNPNDDARDGMTDRPDFSRIDDDPTNDDGAFPLSDEIYGRGRFADMAEDFEGLVDSAMEG